MVDFVLPTLVPALKYGAAGADYEDARETYDSENLVSATRSTAFSPDAGREFYLIIYGSGSATVQLVYSFDDTNYYPMASGVDGGAPIYTNKLAYAGSPLIIASSCDKTGFKVAALPGTVSGTVTIKFAQ